MFYDVESGRALLLMLALFSVFSYLIAFLFLLCGGETGGKESDGDDRIVAESCVPLPVGEICEVEGFERIAETCLLALDQSQRDCFSEGGFISSLSGRIKYKSKTSDGCIVDTWCFKFCDSEVVICD